MTTPQFPPNTTKPEASLHVPINRDEVILAVICYDLNEKRTYHLTWHAQRMEHPNWRHHNAYDELARSDGMTVSGEELHDIGETKVEWAERVLDRWGLTEDLVERTWQHD